MTNPTEAVFTRVAAARGHYESFYLRAVHPSEPLGAWIRYTVHKRPGEQPTGSLWVTVFDAAAPTPYAVKQTIPAPGAGGERWIAIGDSVFGPGMARGRAEAEGRSAAWDLRIAGAEPPLRHLPRDWMYRAPVPRTKLESPLPDATFSGRIEAGERTLELDGWRGMVGHNWGAQHAERWIWLHGVAFAGDRRAWIDCALGRIKVGRWTTPWVANGALSLDGERIALGGVERARRTAVREREDGAELILPAAGATVRARVDAPQLVAWLYADPDGGTHHTVNCSIARLELRLETKGGATQELHTEHGAAYELGMRETTHGVEVQSFPDGG